MLFFMTFEAKYVIRDIRDLKLKFTETITRTVFFLVMLWAPPVEARQCKIFFTAQPQIIPLPQANVIRVVLGASDHVYKIFHPGENYRATAEAESLRMFRDILKTSGLNLHLKVVESARVTSQNEYGVMDYGPWRANGVRLSASVTPFVKGREVIQILDDPAVQISEKQQLVEMILAEIEQVVRWVETHPEYRFKNRTVKITDLDRGDVYDFVSSDGTFSYDYTNRFFALAGSRDRVITGLNPVFNWILTESGDFVLIDPL